MRIRTALIITGIACVLLITGIGLKFMEWRNRADYLESHATVQREKQHAFRCVAGWDNLVTGGAGDLDGGAVVHTAAVDYVEPEVR